MTWEASVSAVESMPVAEVEIDKAVPPWHIWVASLLLVLGFVLGEALIPTKMLADTMAPLKLTVSVPANFAGWGLNPDVMPVLPDPTVEAKLNKLYSETISRTYFQPEVGAVMLTVAYGKNQNSESTAAHRPEFCYSAQGFTVDRVGVKELNINGHKFQAVRLIAQAGARIEPITYWVTLGKHASIPGWQRKMEQFQYGLQGWLADGMLMRVSSVTRSREPQDVEQAFALQERFLVDLAKVMKAEERDRFFGS
jgi:EpsI family protein